MSIHIIKKAKRDSVINIKELANSVRGCLTEERFRHCLGTASLSLSLALHYNYPCYPVIITGLLHDIAKDCPKQKLQIYLQESPYHIDEYTLQHSGLWHAPVSRAIAENIYGIHDANILQAIENHPLGKPAMSYTDIILFTADYCEPYRQHRTSSIRKIAFRDLNLSTYLILCEKHLFLEEQNIQPHPQSLEALQYYKKITGVK